MSKIISAMSAIMRDVPAIAKNRKNTSQGFTFRSIEDVYQSLQPIMSKHGVISVPEVIDERHEDRQTPKGSSLIYRILKIKYTFYCDDGSSVAAVVVGEGMDSGDKASSKAMSVAHKYAMLQVFCIPTEDLEDPDRYAPPESSPDAPVESPEVVAQINECKTMEQLQSLWNTLSAKDRNAHLRLKDAAKARIKAVTNAA